MGAAMKLLTFLAIWICGLCTGMVVCVAISAAKYPQPLLNMPPSYGDDHAIGVLLFATIAFSALIIAGLIRDEMP
jgi:hypothetical protein